MIINLNYKKEINITLQFIGQLKDKDNNILEYIILKLKKDSKV